MYYDKNMAADERDSRCTSCIEVALDYFTLDMNRPSIQPDTTIKAIIGRLFSQFASIIRLQDGQKLLDDAVNQKRILYTIFDSESRAFVTEDCVFMLERLDDHAKATLLAQAVAGLVMIFNRLSNIAVELTPGVLSRELQLFAESEERHAMMATLESSPVLEACYMKSEIADVIYSSVKDEQPDDIPLTTTGQERLHDGVSWVSYRPCRDMGMPWGFTIMAIN